MPDDPESETPQPAKGLWSMMGDGEQPPEPEPPTEPDSEAEEAAPKKGLWSMIPATEGEPVEEETEPEVAESEAIPSREEVLGITAKDEDEAVHEPVASPVAKGEPQPAPRNAHAAAFMGIVAVPLAALGLFGGIPMRLPGLVAGLLGVVLGLAAWHETRPRRNIRYRGRAMAAAGLVLGGAGLLAGPLVFSPIGEKWIDDRHKAATAAKAEKLGEALDSFHTDSGHFPIGRIAESDGRGMHGWMTSLLPYLGKQNLYERIDRDQPWSSEKNAPVFRERITAFEASGMSRDAVGAGFAPSHFAGVGGRSADAETGLVFFGIFSRSNEPVSRDDVIDGQAQTLAVGTISQMIPAWGSPENIRQVGNGLNRSPNGFGNYNGTGATFLHVDGSVKFYSNRIDAKVLHALSTRDGEDGD